MIFNKNLSLGRHSDLFMVMGAVAIIGLMILPVPTFMLDGLIALNIVLGVTLVLVAIYIAAPTDFSAFPSLLLITTLYRLSLSIATTRMILTKAHAGRIIDVFGHVATGGNLVVGLVVFLIITVVQYIVVAKGADRVAEVAARFSLDAMPGKQMSIDSDLRSGLTEKDDARRRRRLLELEGKLHGSLDGAMKFVKGDALAGIVIVLINLLGGLTVGMLQRGLPFSEAINTYSVLTIGDGMVTQIPALMAALAAGLLVTRIAGDGNDGHLGEVVQRQLIQKPRVLLVAGCLCWLMALVPGFPTAIFIGLGCLGVAAGVMLDKALMRTLAARFALFKALQELVEAHPADIAPTPVPVRPLVVTVDGLAANSSERSALTRALGAVLEQFEAQLGVPLPALALQPGPATGDQAELRWRVMALELCVGEGTAAAESLVGDVSSGVRRALRRNLAMFMGVQEASLLLQRCSGAYPEAAKEATRSLSIVRIAEVLRLLVEEEVPIRNLHLILERLADAGQTEKDGQLLANMARLAVCQHIVARYSRAGEIRAIAVAGPLEKQLREALRNQFGQHVLALDPSIAARLLELVRSLLEAQKADVVVTAMDLRRPLRRLLSADLFDTPVLAYPELRPPVKVRLMARIPPLRLEAVDAAA